MNPALVSVIMPVYNGERFIAQAVASVLAQTYQHWELIIVNDGSTDGTAGIVAGYTDHRVRCIHQENRGLAAARNTGIRAARGEYLAFLDADDEWKPSFLSKCTDAIEDNTDPRIVGVYTSHVYIDEIGQVLPQPGNGIVSPNELCSRLIAGNFFPPCVVVVRVDIVREVGMFDETLPGQGTEDKDLWFRITRKYTLLGIAEPLARYRVYPGSMSTNAAKMHANRMAVLKKHFGPDEGDPVQWSPEKRLAYSRGYRGSSLEHIDQGEVNLGWAFLLRGASISPSILSEVQTYYEMACLKQPRGYRGRMEELDVEGTGNDLMRMLNIQLVATEASLRSLQAVAKGYACLALAQLADQAGAWRLARHYMWQAFIASPRSFASTANIRRLMKLMIGKRLATVLQSLRKSESVKLQDSAGVKHV